MKAIINGARYDTDKAALIGTARGGSCPKTDWTEDLYETPRAGRFFLAGKGGGRTRYAERGAEGWWPGERIMPMGRAEAFAWAQEHLPAVVVEAHFADMIEEA